MTDQRLPNRSRCARRTWRNRPRVAGWQAMATPDEEPGRVDQMARRRRRARLRRRGGLPPDQARCGRRPENSQETENGTGGHPTGERRPTRRRHRVEAMPASPAHALAARRRHPVALSVVVPAVSIARELVECIIGAPEGTATIASPARSRPQPQRAPPASSVAVGHDHGGIGYGFAEYRLWLCRVGVC
jgi:hypothetical protein